MVSSKLLYMSREFKVCPRCDVRKPVERFPLVNRALATRHVICKACKGSPSKVRYWERADCGYVERGNASPLRSSVKVRSRQARIESLCRHGRCLDCASPAEAGGLTMLRRRDSAGPSLHDALILSDASFEAALSASEIRCRPCVEHELWIRAGSPRVLVPGANGELVEKFRVKPAERLSAIVAA